jgi:hypothetical protein
MRDSFTTVAGTVLIVGLLALVPLTAAAQFAGESPFARNDAPPIVTDFGAGQAGALNDHFEAEFTFLGVFGGKRRLDRFDRSSGIERPMPWKLYGRLGVFNFQRELEPQYDQGLRFSWRKTGPRLTGRVYIGIHRTFD